MSIVINVVVYFEKSSFISFINLFRMDNYYENLNIVNSPIMTSLQETKHIYSILFSNSEASASELHEHLKDIFLHTNTDV